MREKPVSFLSKAVIFCKSYIGLSLWLLVFAVGIRFFEALLLSRVNHVFVSNVGWNLTGLCYDIALYLRISVWILIVFVATCFLSEKKSRVVLRIFQALMLLLSLISIVFFATSGFLLDKVVFTYSLQEIIGIIKSSSKSPFWVYAVVVVLPALYFYLSRIRIKINNILLITFAVCTILSFFLFNNLSLSTNQYHIKTNKEHFFFKSVLKRQTFVFKENDEDIVKTVEEFRSYFPEYQFEGAEYPFLYKATYNDVLSPFFNLKSEPPNLVFIVVEGLGYDFVENDYQLMPFLDSLSKKSLTWEHCLSVSSRTFGVFPALFGSAPLGEKGFMDRCPNNPEHHSLLRILYQNNYTNHLFYGGWMGFDNMGDFSKANNTTYLKKEDWDEDITAQKIETYWGYEDHLTYLQAQRKLEKVKSSPRTEIYLTLSTHDPWECPQSDYFQDVVTNKVNQTTTLSEKQKKDIINYIGVYCCFAYSDWSIQQLIKDYEKRDDFDNTIFIITGDHSAFTKQFGGYYNYHVPLIIYSEMLKSGRKMKGVVSHRDITPTFLSLLQNNFDIKTPPEVTWLNTALDTSLTFRANTFSPLQPIGHSVDGIVYKNYLLCEDILEEITADGSHKIDNPYILQQMNRLLSLYRYLDLYVLNNNALIKNLYAHRKITNVIFNVEDTIAQKSHFAKNSKLKVTEGPENHKTTLYFDGSNIYPIEFLRLNVPDDNVELIRVEIEFKIYIKNEDNTNLMVSVNEWGVSSKIDYLGASKQNKWYTYKNSLTYKKEVWEAAEKDIMKISLWNSNKLEGYIDDIKVKVTAD